MTETPQQAARRLAAFKINEGFRPVTLHEYRNADGDPAFWRIRLKNDNGRKWIRPMRLNGHGYELKEPAAPDTGRVLYRLRELLASPDAPVWIVEGETCADALAKAGKVATTSGSASSAGGADWTPLKSRDCIVWPDNDAPGRGYAQDVAEHLQRLGCRVRVVETDPLELDVGGDVVDWQTTHPEGDVDKLATRELAAPESAIATMEWGPPAPLVAKIAPVPYPLDSLPTTIRAAVDEVRGFVKAPTALIALSALSALSLATQAQVDVKRAEKLDGPSSLFMLAIADSGERKSTCDRFFTAAIREFQQDKAVELEPEVKRYRADHAAWESRREGVLAAIKAAAKNGKEDPALRQSLRSLEQEEPSPPPVPNLVLGDETPESLSWRLAKEWPSSGVLSAEAGIVFGAHAMGKDSIMRNLALLNVLWDGGELSIGRRTTESFTVRGARLTLGLQVQEDTLREFLIRSGQLARGSGFLARFLIAWPASTQGQRPFTESPESWPCLAAFHERIRQILNTEVPVDPEGRLVPAMLTLAPDAKAAWIEFHDAVEGELADGGDLHDVRDVASKAADNVARLAAIFHTFERATGPISVEAVRQASAIVLWHLNESRRFFGELALAPELADAMRLDAWLLAYCKREHVAQVGKRHAHQFGPVREGKHLDATLTLLAELGRVALVKKDRKLNIEVNPALLEEVSR